MVEITDRESAEAWLATQPHEVQILMASRAALRVLPLVLEDEPDPALILASMRAILTSRAAAVGPARDVKARLESAAYSAARSAARLCCTNRLKGVVPLYPDGFILRAQ